MKKIWTAILNRIRTIMESWADMDYDTVRDMSVGIVVITIGISTLLMLLWCLIKWR